MSDNLRGLTVKMRGEHRSGKTQILIALERLARSFGMQTRMDADGHNLSIISSAADRIRLYEHNHGRAPAGEAEADA